MLRLPYVLDRLRVDGCLPRTTDDTTEKKFFASRTIDVSGLKVAEFDEVALLISPLTYLSKPLYSPREHLSLHLASLFVGSMSCDDRVMVTVLRFSSLVSVSLCRGS